VRVMEIKAEVLITPMWKAKQLRMPADIFVENFIKVLYALFSEDTVTIVKTDGTETEFYGHFYKSRRGWTYEVHIMKVDMPEGKDYAGIFVGASSEEERMDNYNLIAKYPHGTETNQIYYGNTTVSDLGFDEENKRHVIRVRRLFENKSPNDLVIAEVGLVADFYTDVTGRFDYLISRCVLPSPFTLPVGRAMYIDYFLYLHF